MLGLGEPNYWGGRVALVSLWPATMPTCSILYYCILLSELDVGQLVEHFIKKFDIDAQFVG